MLGTLNRFLLSAAIVSLYPLVCFSQTGNLTSNLLPKPKFEYLSREQGLSYSNVLCILQDRKGFLWFGTEDGLNKYDGYKFTIYKRDPNSAKTLSVNHIYCLYEDHQGFLWVGTYLGLNRFDVDSETFRSYLHEPENPRSLSHNVVKSILEFPKGSGKLWVGTQGGGVNYLDSRNETFRHYRHDPQTPGSLDSDRVLVCYEDYQGVMWVGTDKGLNRYNPESETFQHYHNDPYEPKSISGGDISSIYEDQHNTLWLGTHGGGLNRFDRESETFQHYQHDPQNPASLSHNWVDAISEDKSGILWISTRNGLNLFDPANEVFHHVKHEPSNPWGMRSTTVKVIYRDNAGELWLAPLDRGVCRLKQESSIFRHFKHIPDNPMSLIGNKVNCFSEDRLGMIWVGSYTDGLNLFDRRTSTFQPIQHNPGNPQSFISKNAGVIYEDHQGTVWVGTNKVGLNRYDRKNETFQQFMPDQKPSGLSGETILSIYEATTKPGVLWVGTFDKGLNRFDVQSETFRHYRHDPQNPESISDNDISCIYEGPSEPGVLWIGTYKGGLNRFDPESEKFRHYRYDPQNPRSLSSDLIFAIHEDRTGILWVGTGDGGLNSFDRQTGSFVRYGESEGLPSSCIFGILEDDRGNLWIGTANGISRFNPRNSTFKNYNARDGLQGSQFNQSAYLKLNSGEMVFGGNNGFNIFHPDSVKDNPYVPPVVFTGLKRYNTEGSGGGAVEERGISEKKKVELSYEENIFTVEFAALNFRIPEKNQYSYRLEGFNEQWIQLGTKHDITFTNLDAGEYTLRVKGSNNDGIWNEEGAALKIIVHPPWWKTWWAYSFYALVIGAALYGIRRFELNRQRLKQEAQSLAEVDRLKSRFFANISHEFRTPLTLILGPLAKLTSRVNDRESREDLGMMQRNANRLLQLINQLLDLSKLEGGRMKLQAGPENIVPLLRGLTTSFESLAIQKGIDLQFHTAAEEIIVYVERDKIEKILINLLSNAFKFTSDGGAISVTVDTSLNPPPTGGLNESPFEGGLRGMLQITVSDTGSGIPAEHLDKIFDRFYQVADSLQGDSKYTRATGGTGIGLALTKELVELHHGAISVSSEPGKGTAFVIRLPLGKEHLQEDEIVYDGGHLIADTPYRRPDAEKEITIVDQAAETVELTPAPPPSEKSGTILIVEDNPDMRAYMRGHLENDHRIIEAENGVEGLKLARKSTPALIISDVMMPEMDGFQFCEKIKADVRTSHIPVILLTAKASGESKIEGLETGADDYLTKPFDAKELLVRVKNLIEQRRRLTERFQRDLKVQPKDITVTSVDELLLQKVIHIVDENMANDDFDTATLARQAGISRGHLNSKLRALTNCTSREFVRTLRLKRAAQLLEQDFGNVTEVAYEVGFNSPAHFSKVFRGHFGVVPKAYVSQLKQL